MKLIIKTLATPTMIEKIIEGNKLAPKRPTIITKKTTPMNMLRFKIPRLYCSFESRNGRGNVFRINGIVISESTGEKRAVLIKGAQAIYDTI